LAERTHRDGFFHEGIEIVFDGRAHRIDFPGLCGRRVALWPQTEMVKDLIAARVETGAPLEFEVTDVAVHDLRDAPRVTYSDADGTSHALSCDVIAGCDGFHGICRETVASDLTLAT